MEPARIRPLVTIVDGVVMLDGVKAKVIIRKERIFVGCHDITPEALKFLADAWEEQYGDGVVLQDGIYC